MENSIINPHTMHHQNIFYLNQYPKPLPPSVGSTRILGSKGLIVTNTAMIQRSLFIRKHYPEPPPNKIGEEDLPGGFRHSNIMTGRGSPLYDLSRGIIQIDDVKVLFDAKA